MRHLLLLLLSVTWSLVFTAPVQPEIPMPKEGEPIDADYLQLEYKKYLDEVVQVLEADDEFKKQLEQMNAEADGKDLQSGQIAHYLQFANQNTRTKLDELKRIELRRLKDLHKRMIRETAAEMKKNGRKPRVEDLPKVDNEHVDHKNPHTFESDDLKKLIQKATDDLSELDKKRRGEFKAYELNKEHEYREKLKHADKEGADKMKKEHEDQIKHHKDHPKVNHPGGKENLEEVWEEEDNMEKDQFDPRAFFMLHDVDADGYLSIPEIEALFQNELDKVYNESDPADDPVERQEEMNRMREHILKEIDADNDMMISYDEFIQSTKKDEFEKDQAWDTLDEEDFFDSKEFDAFENALEGEEHDYNKEPLNKGPDSDTHQQPSQDSLDKRTYGDHNAEHGEQQLNQQAPGQPPANHQADIEQHQPAADQQYPNNGHQAAADPIVHEAQPPAN